MPAPGDQHRDTPATANPFLLQAPHITDFTAQEIATLQSRLDKQLGPEYISTRPGNGGGKVHYLAAEKVINLANEVFGFNGWSSQIQNVQIDFVDENSQSGRINLGLSTIVRVTLRDGTFHEDIGYGHCENAKGKAAAFEKAKKEAATDAMKRALRNFGNVLGNCLYDKDYLQKVTKLKVAASKWDAENLHRHPDFAPIKREPAVDDISLQNKSSVIQRNTSVQSVHSARSFNSTEEDEYGNAFDESVLEHPDEVRLDDTMAMAPTPQVPKLQNSLQQNGVQQNGVQQNGQRHNVQRAQQTPQARQPNDQPSAMPTMVAPERAQNPPRIPGNTGQATGNMLPPQNALRPQPIPTAPQQQNQDSSRSNPSSGTTSDSAANLPQQRPLPSADGQAQPMRPVWEDENSPLPREPPVGVPVGFVTGNKADMFNKPGDQKMPNGNIAFNPHADSPSIRRTQGINPGRSAPVTRSALNGGGNAQTPAQQTTGGVPGPQNVGTNGFSGGQRPVGTNYVNPQADMNRKVGLPQGGAAGGFQNRAGGYRPPSAIKRPAMTDVTNTHGTDSGGSDPKKVKVDGGGDAAQPGEQHVMR